MEAAEPVIPDRGVKQWSEERLIKAKATTRFGLASFMTASRSPGTLYVVPAVRAARPRAVLVWRPDNELLPAAVVGARSVKMRLGPDGQQQMIGEIHRLRIIFRSDWFDWWDPSPQGFWFDCAKGSPVTVEMGPR